LALATLLPMVERSAVALRIPLMAVRNDIFLTPGLVG
jgi:hypothetical protein